MNRLIAGALAALMTTFLVAQASAAPLAIAEHSFETLDDSCGTNTWCNVIGPEWVATNDGGVTTTQNDGGFFEENIGGFSADGANHIGVTSGWSIFQQLGTNYDVDTVYTMTVGVGNRDGHTQAGNTSTFGLLDGNGAVVASSTVDASSLAAGEFADYTFSFTTTSADALAGTPVLVAISNLDLTAGTGGPGRAHFDNIRLDASPVPEPAGMLCMGVLAMGMLGLRRRR